MCLKIGYNNTINYMGTNNIREQFPIYFKQKNKLSNARLLFQYFKNHVDDHGNINSPPNTNMNVLDIFSDLLSTKKKISDIEKLNFYKYMIDKLNIPIHLIQNNHVKNSLASNIVKFPLGGSYIKKEKNKRINIKNKWKA